MYSIILFIIFIEFDVNMSFFFKELNTLIQQDCIKLIKSDSKDIYNTIGFYF